MALTPALIGLVKSLSSRKPFKRKNGYGISGTVLCAIGAITMPTIITDASGSKSIHKKPNRYFPKRTVTSRMSSARMTRNCVTQGECFGMGIGLGMSVDVMAALT
jgi:hypothetical protein